MVRIKSICREIYEEYYHKTNRDLEVDSSSLAVVYSLAKKGLIDKEEVRFLWTNYLTKGILYVEKAIQMAEERRDAEDIRKTEEELIAWLHRGI